MVPYYGHKSSLIIEMVKNETHIAPPQARVLIFGESGTKEFEENMWY
jgi:transcriptional regulator with PAS, ATPase and Fis domain